jgi:hypothetical protein
VSIEDVQPSQCYARAQRLWAEVRLIRTEMGRSEDPRPVPELTNVQPREVYFQALAVWHKTERLADELGGRTPRPTPRAPAPKDLLPGHVLQLIDATLGQIEDLKQRLQIDEKAREPAIEPMRKPADVLTTLLRASRDLSRLLERPFTPSDCYRAVALASAYASQLGGRLVNAPFERNRRPADCYVQLERCLALTTALIAKAGHPTLAQKGQLPDALPGDVYDLAYLVVGELAFLHSLGAYPPVQPYETAGCGHRLPSHVHQLARVLEAQLVVL